jgi:hypothetical protein
LTQNYTSHYYRLIGITSFGELTAPSPVLKTMGRDRTAPPNPIIEPAIDYKGTIKIAWKYPTAPADLKGFAIGKSFSSSGPFQKQGAILPVNSREWVDEKPEILGGNYYVVYAIDTAGNESESYATYGFLRDSIAPSTPSVPTGTIDTNGIVRLKWKLGPEMDIMGYRVLFSNAPDHEFSMLTPEPLADTTYTDSITLNTLTRKIYYRIAAVDRNFNHSKLSDILTLEKPDLISPVQPLFSNFIVSDSSVFLQIIQSSSTDVSKHLLLRREADNLPWATIANWSKPDSKSSYSDLSVQGGTYYQYALQAVDSAGNKSALSPTVEVKTVPRKNREAIKSGTAVFNVEKKAVDLKWIATTKPVKYYVIYRGKDGNAPISLISVDGKSIGYLDNTWVGKGKYSYLLKAVYTDYGESPYLQFNEVVIP